MGCGLNKRTERGAMSEVIYSVQVREEWSAVTDNAGRHGT